MEMETNYYGLQFFACMKYLYQLYKLFLVTSTNLEHVQ